MALELNVIVKTKQGEKALKKLTTNGAISVRKLEKASTTSAKKMTKGFKDFNKVLGGLGLGLGIAAAVKGFNNLISAASDTEESLNKVREVFGEAAISVEKFSETAAESLGASTEAALAMTGEIGNLLVAMKFSENAAAGFSTKMVQLAADLGSFNNVPTADALNAIRSALVGESEPIRRFGADVRQTRLDSIALGLGLEFTKGKMDAQTKALAAMEAIMQDTRKAQGDFRRTSDGFANSQKILAANFGDLQAIMGQKLIPTMKGAVDLLTGFIKTFTESKFDKAIGRLIKLGADVNFINQLKLQNQINESLKDRTRIAEEINDFAIETRRNLIAQIADNEKLNKLVGSERLKELQVSLDQQIKIAKETKDTKDVQKTITELQRLSFSINEKNVAIATDAVVATKIQKNVLEETEDIIIGIVGQVTQFLLNLKEQESIEKRIKDLKLEQSGVTTTINEKTDKLNGLTFEIANRQAEFALALGRGAFAMDLLKNKTATMEVFLNDIAVQMSFVGLGIGKATSGTQIWQTETEKVKFELQDAAGVLNDILLMVKGARRFSLSGILGIGAGIAALIPGGQAVAAGLQAGSIATRGFQGGGSFTVPGTGSGDRPHLVNLEPGENVDITPRNQVNNNQKITMINNFHFQIADEITIKTKVVPILNDFVIRQGGKLVASGVK